MANNLPAGSNGDIDRRRDEIGELIKLKNADVVALEYWWRRKSLKTLERYIEAENAVLDKITERSRKMNLIDNIDRLHALDLMEIEAQIAGFKADKDEAEARSARAKREIKTGDIDLKTHRVLEKVRRDVALRDDEVHELENANRIADLTPKDELTPGQVAIQMAHDWEKLKVEMQEAGIRENDPAWKEAKSWYSNLDNHFSK